MCRTFVHNKYLHCILCFKIFHKKKTYKKNEQKKRSADFTLFVCREKLTVKQVQLIGGRTKNKNKCFFHFYKSNVRLYVYKSKSIKFCENMFSTINDGSVRMLNKMKFQLSKTQVCSRL